MELNVRTASLRRQRRGKVAGLLWKAGILILMLSLTGIGVRYLAMRFFFENPEYDLRHLETNLHGLMSDAELSELTGIRPGKNIMLLDLGEASRRLSALPEVRAVNIERRLPDTVEVGIERRLPVFLLSPASGASGSGTVPDAGESLLCDKEGVVMRSSRLPEESRHLPLLSGIDTAALKQGERLDDERFRNALAVTEALSELPGETLSVAEADVSKPYAVVITDSSGARYTFGPSDLPGQMERLRKLLDHCREADRRIQTANLMTQRNTPVTFVLTPEDRSARITPVSPFPKKQNR
jgi:cell division septal protein FtsQ